MAYDLSSIKLNIKLGDTKKAVDQINALVKQLENRKVKLEVDVTAIKAGVDVATKEIEKAYQEQIEAKKKAENENLKITKQSHEQALVYLKKQQQEIKNTYGVDSKLTFNKNPNADNQITSAMISFQKETGKAETKVYNLNESIKTVAETGEKIKNIKLAPATDKLTDDVVKVNKELSKAQGNLEKFKNSMNINIKGIEVGTNGDWATNLQQFSDLKVKMDELNSMQANGENLDVIANKIKEINDLYSKTTTEITRVTQLNKELSSNNGFNNNVTQSVEKYNTQLDSLITKNEKLANNPAMQKVREDVQKLNNTPPTEFSNACKQVENDISKIKSQMDTTTKKGTSFFGDLGSSAKKAFGYLGGATVIYKFADAVRQIPLEVKKVDTSLVELNKVANLSQQELNSFMNTAYELGDGLAKTGSQVADATTEFIKAGYELSTATSLGQDTLMSMNVGTGLDDLDTATGAMIATLKGFEMEASNSNKVVSTMAKVADETAIGYGELADGITRVSATMNQGQTSFEQTLGLLTSTFELSQNIEKSATGLNSISQRMRGLKLGEDGSLEKDAEMLGKVEGALKDIANVYLRGQDGQLRSTFDVLQDLSKEWKTLSINQQQYLSEKLAGNRQNVVLSQILSNWEAVDKAIVAASNSTGYAEEVNARYLDSVNGKLAALESSWQRLATNTLSSDMLKDTISLTNEFVKLLDACGGLDTVLVGVTTSFIALKVATAFLNGGQLSGSIGLIISKMLMYKATTDATTGSVIALSMATKLLVGGAIVGGVMIIGGAIKYIGESSERAKEKVNELNSEINNMVSYKSQADELVKQYEALNKLSKSQKLNNDEQVEFIRVQNELAQLYPELSGYRDENNNFMLTETDLVKKLNSVYEELILNKREEKAETAKKLIGSDLKEYEKDINNLEKLKKQQSALMEYQANGNSYEGMSKEARVNADIVISLYGNAEEALKSVNNEMSIVNSSIGNSSKDIKQGILDIVYSTEEWVNLTDSEKDAISKFVTNKDISSLATYAKGLKDGSMSVETFTSEVLKSPEAIDYMNQALEKTNNTINDSTNATESQISAFENLKKEFDSITSDVDMLNSTLKSLNENHSLSAKEISSLAEKYPQLLKHLNDEESLRLGLQEEITNTVQAQEKAYSDMLMSSEGYYNSLIAQDTDSRNELLWILDTYNNTVDSEHAKQLEDFQNLESLKIEATAKIISELGKLWQQYFSTLSKSFSQQGFDGGANIKYDMTKDQFDAMSNLKKSEYQKAIDNAKNSPIAKEYEAMYKKFEEASNTFANFTPTYNSSNSNKLGNSSGSKGSSSGGSNSAEKQIKEQFDAKIKAILAGSDALERTILLTQQQLEMAELNGEEDKATKLKQQLIDQQKEKRDILTKQADELRALLSKTNDPEIKAGINDEIIKLQDDFHASKMQSYEDEIALIQRRNDLEKQAYDDRIKQIEIEQMLIKEDSDGYKALEEEKLSLLMGLQQGYQDKIKSLKAQGLTNEHEFVREYINLWQDAEVERLNMIKARADKEREVQLKALDEESKKYESQKKAMNDLLKLTIDMIKKEYEAKKNAIQDEIKLKEDSVKAELDGYKRIIDAKKESLQDAKDERSYQKGLDEKNKNIKDTEDKLLALSGDNSLKAQAEKKKLEAELQKYREELADYQYDKNIEQQMGALDDEYKLYEESKNKELDAYKEQKEMELKLLEEQTAKEGNIRKEAMDRLQKDGKSTYEQLLKYSSEYTDISQKEFDEMWGAANEAINAYSDSSMSLIDIMSALADEMKRIADESQRIKNQSWTDFVDDKEDLNSGGNTNKPSDKPNGGKPNNKPDSGLSQKGKEQLNQQKYLHDQMIVANETKNENLKKWIEKERVKWGIDPKTGAIVKQFHKGLDYGQVGTGLKANELILKATSDEWVFTNKQMSNLTSNINGMINTKQPNSITVQVDKFMDVANIDKGVDIGYLVSKATDAMYKSLNATFKLNGFQPIR